VGFLKYSDLTFDSNFQINSDQDGEIHSKGLAHWTRKLSKILLSMECILRVLVTISECGFWYCSWGKKGFCNGRHKMSSRSFYLVERR